MSFCCLLLFVSATLSNNAATTNEPLLASQLVLNDNDNEPLRSSSTDKVSLLADERRVVARSDVTTTSATRTTTTSTTTTTISPTSTNSLRSNERIDVVIGGDSNYWPGMFAAAKSIVESASRATQRRLHVHLLADEADGDERLSKLALLIECAHSSGAMMRDVGAPQPLLSMLRFDSRRFPFQVTWSESKNSLLRNLTSPHNFARFYLAQLLPPAVRKIIWLDTDVVVRGDIAALFDGALRDDDRRARVFAACVTNRRFDFMIDMSPSSPLIVRKPALAKCYQSAACEHFNAGVSLMRLDRWRERNITAHIESWITFLNEHSTLVCLFDYINVELNHLLMFIQAFGMTQPLLLLEFFEEIERIDWRVRILNEI